jgi:MFS family permease
MTTSTPSDPQPISNQARLLTMIGMVLALLLAALDQTIVATAGPEIQKSLNIQPSLYTWLTISYLVSSTVVVTIYGKLGDLYGRKPSNPRPGETALAWTFWQIIAMFATFVIGLIAFIITERRAKDPLLDLSLFKNRTFALGNLTGFVLQSAFFRPSCSCHCSWSMWSDYRPRSRD